MNDTIPRYITLDEASEILSLDDKTVRRYIRDGRLAGYRIGPRALRVTLDDVLGLIEPIEAGEIA